MEAPRMDTIFGVEVARGDVALCYEKNTFYDVVVMPTHCFDGSSRVRCRSVDSLQYIGCSAVLRSAKVGMISAWPQFSSESKDRMEVCSGLTLPRPSPQAPYPGQAPSTMQASVKSVEDVGLRLHSAVWPVDGANGCADVYTTNRPSNRTDPTSDAGMPVTPSARTKLPGNALQAVEPGAGMRATSIAKSIQSWSNDSFGDLDHGRSISGSPTAADSLDRMSWCTNESTTDGASNFGGYAASETCDSAYTSVASEVFEGMASPEVVTSSSLPAVPRGSMGHATGTCRPCAHVWKPGGCSKGDQCERCHFCGEEEFKRYRDESRVNARARAHAHRRRAAAGGTP